MGTITFTMPGWTLLLLVLVAAFNSGLLAWRIVLMMQDRTERRALLLLFERWKAWKRQQQWQGATFSEQPSPVCWRSADRDTKSGWL